MPTFNRQSPVDYVTALEASYWGELQDNIEDYGAQFLPLSGEIMTGPVTWYATQTFSASSTISPLPTYTKDATGSGGVFSCYNHIHDRSIHWYYKNIIRLESSISETQQGSAKISGTLEANAFVGNGSGLTNITATSTASANWALVANTATHASTADMAIESVVAQQAETSTVALTANYALSGPNSVTNGDLHDHLGGDGAQINHVNLANVGTNSHSQIDTHVSSSHVNSFSSRTGTVTPATNDYTWAQVDKTVSNLTDITTKSHTSLTDIGTNTHVQVDSHIGSASNPHSVTSTQVGLGSVTNEAQIVKSIGTTKGDLIAFSANATPIRHPVDIDGYVLTADSTQSAGIKWGAVGSIRGAYSNLVVKNNSTNPIYQVDVDADSIALYDGTSVKEVRDVNLTISIAVTGANGLDTGSEAISTWYYIWTINNGTTTAGLLSASYSSPSMPSGYTYKRLVGAVRNNVSSDFLKFKQTNEHIRYYDWAAAGDGYGHGWIILNGVNSATWVDVDVSTCAPTISDRVIVNYKTAGGASIRENDDTSEGVTICWDSPGTVDIGIDSSGIFEHKEYGGGTLYLGVVGYYLTL